MLTESTERPWNEVMMTNFTPKQAVSKRTNIVMSFKEAYKALVNEASFRECLEKEIDEKIETKSDNKTVIKNKEYFKKLKAHYCPLIKSAALRLNLNIREMSLDKFVSEAFEKMYGYDILAELYYSDKDSEIGLVTGIFCISSNKIYYESSKTSGFRRFEKSFDDEQDYDYFIERLLKAAGKGNLDNGENKYVDFDLYEDRYQAIAKHIAASGSVLTIRLHSEDHVTMQDIIRQGGMTKELADFIGLLYIGKCNTLIAGITGSGKTTTLRAILDEYVRRTNSRILVCEDTRELFLQNPHTIELVTSIGVAGSKSNVTLRDLVTYLALREQPDYVVVGEVRGPEAEAAVEAAATGHSTHLTMHSGTPIDAINRLETKYIQQMPTLSPDIVERIIGAAIDFIIIQDNIPGIGRRISYVSEVSYDYDKGRVKLRDIVRFDVKTKSYQYINKPANDKTDLMLRRGVNYEQIRHMETLFNNKVPTEPIF